MNSLGRKLSFLYTGGSVLQKMGAWFKSVRTLHIYNRCKFIQKTANKINKSQNVNSFIKTIHIS